MTPQQLVDALEAGTLVIPADYREILQAMATQINAGGGGGGWATTGTTTLTGATVIDTDGNQLDFNGDVSIKNNLTGDNVLLITSTLNEEQAFLNVNNITDDGNYAQIAASTNDTSSSVSIESDFNDGVKTANILCSTNATEGIIILEASDGIDASQAIPAYADNAAALSALGAGKLYYTDVAGEYIVKMSH